MGHGITSSDSLFSVRQMPWHGLGVVLDEPPKSIDEALVAAGLDWKVKQGDVLVCHAPEWTDDFGNVHPADIRPAEGFRANLREDTGKVLGIVTDDYSVLDNREAFHFLDELIGSSLHFETAGSLHGGRRVWVLARLPEFVEVGGDAIKSFLYVANSHDGSLAVTAAVTPIRIVCANTLGAALRHSEHGQAAQRTFRFRHTGSIRDRVYEARKVMQIAVNYTERFKALGDSLALAPMSPQRFERAVLDKLFVVDEDTPPRARSIRAQTKATILDIFNGQGEAGDTRGNAPRTKWAAWNAVGEYADYHRRYTQRTNQVARSFEDTALKDRALALVEAA